ncbi:MAG: hypothetical protein C0596_05865 [Marinilabiliales bacterium]|nr:MAG: hypothetical protein C0596_05865 [Marinilabiliales bacterium]
MSATKAILFLSGIILSVNAYSQKHQTPGPMPHKSVKERMEMIDKKICQKLEITDDQETAIKDAFYQFYKSMDELMPKPDDKHPAGPPPKDKIEDLKKIRDNKIKEVLAPKTYIKYLKLERKTRPQQPQNAPPPPR